MGNGNDNSSVSSSNSFSSVDTNQTLLNSIANMQHQQRLSPPLPSSIANTTNRQASNHSYRTKYGQYMIITPAVSIDRDFDHNTTFSGGVNEDGSRNDDDNSGNAATVCDDIDDSYFNNGNIFRMSLLQSSVDSGNSSDSSFHSNYNSYIHTSRQHLLPKGDPHFYTFSSWRWCTLICAAMRCFSGGHTSNTPYRTNFRCPPYQRSRSSGGGGHTSSTPHQRLRSSSFTAETAFEHFSAPFKPRKTRDHMNNITYEL